MRMHIRGFTLIELMIVIAIIAIIAAIAIPNMLESRVTAQESATATALRTGILPAEVQFQAAGYVDPDGDGVGSFAVDSPAYAQMSGTQAIQGIQLTLLAPAYGVSSNPTISGYVFQMPMTGTNTADDDERVWAVGAYPISINNGRRRFICNQAGGVYGSLPSTGVASGFNVLDASVFDSTCSGAPSSLVWRPYSR